MSVDVADPQAATNGVEDTPAPRHRSSAADPKQMRLFPRRLRSPVPKRLLPPWHRHLHQNRQTTRSHSRIWKQSYYLSWYNAKRSSRIEGGSYGLSWQVSERKSRVYNKCQANTQARQRNGLPLLCKWTNNTRSCVNCQNVWNNGFPTFTRATRCSKQPKLRICG